MSNAEQLLRAKGNTIAIASLPPTATVTQAAQLMNARRIGSVLVIEDDHLIGIFTERDVLTRIVAAERHPSVTTLSEVMTSPVACASPQTTLDEMRKVIRERRIRHLPVIDDYGHVLGMISIGDLNRAEHDVQEQTIRYLETYMTMP